MMNRRNLLIAGALLPLAGTVRAEEECKVKVQLDVIAVENDTTREVPFFEHYHLLLIPVSALVELPANGIDLETSRVDQGSLNEESFNNFIESLIASGQIKKGDTQAIQDFRDHKPHKVKLTRDQLKEIASGKELYLKVISENNNDVHEFIIKASPSALARVSYKNA
jgi:hypothetical protein